ncbi:MAG: hypothetical protein M3139_06545 [Bacteroidota bacterium]|nr:hypothetical protein [Bacteroidota bacterium]
MQSEESNNTFHWKNKLQELENLQTDAFDKEAAWDKLHARLHNKPAKKKFIWYWAAAAVLLIALTFPWLKKHNKDPKIVKIESTNADPKQNAEPQLNNEKNHIVENTTGPLQRKYRIINKDNLKKKNLPVSKVLHIQNQLGDTVSTQFLTGAITKLLPVTLFPKHPLMSVQSKKLIVIHINEVGDPIEDNPAIVKNTERHSFQLRLASQEVFINPGMSSQSMGVTILKSKTSPN